MAEPIDIGTLIDRDPKIRGGRPKIAGTGVTVMRIAGWHNQGWIPEEIAANYQYISLAQVHAALAYYHANKEEIDADIEAEARFYEAAMHRRFTKHLPCPQSDSIWMRMRLPVAWSMRFARVGSMFSRPGRRQMINRDDDEHLEFATAQGRALYSFNSSDYCRLHAEWTSNGRSHAGIIVGRQQPFEVGRQLTSLLHLASAKSAEEMSNNLEFLSAWG